MSWYLPFWLAFLAALIAGTIFFSPGRVNWPCGDETCFFDYVTINTGP